ncbi:MAG: hypothetical protein HOE54_09830, partial [Gammaproteobacteria bacterium]|nr:hypothetical protein [Gammaproteobacteria bacterium]
MELKNYHATSNAWDELLTDKLRARRGLRDITTFLRKSSLKDLNQRRYDAELAIRS